MLSLIDIDSIHSEKLKNLVLFDFLRLSFQDYLRLWMLIAYLKMLYYGIGPEKGFGCGNDACKTCRFSMMKKYTPL